MLWRLHIWWLLSLGLISCSPRSPQVALSREALGWQELVRGDEERMAESREATVKALAESGQVSLAQELALSIPNYKRGTSWAEIATILFGLFHD